VVAVVEVSGAIVEGAKFVDHCCESLDGRRGMVGGW
jgi:hypothetical protein